MRSSDILRQINYELARRSFWEYCQLMAGAFYKDSRAYLKEFCDSLEAFYRSDERVLVVNMPPRHGKSRTASLFVEWVLGINPKEQIMTGSYNETLSTTFSKTVRNDIQSVKVAPEKVVYSDVFPRTRIKQGDASMNLWSLEGAHSSYLATSPTGTATGFGCTLMIIDDIIKNAEEAYNEGIKAKHWDWFTNTMLSRLEEGGKIIIVMTRWATDDLAGRVLEYFNSDKIRHITLRALKVDGTMLCSEVLSRQSYEEKTRLMGADIASANYQQIPIDLQGRLYTSLKTYDDIPRDVDGEALFEQIKAYTDTADTGSDYTCSIVYGVYQQEAYILDVLYTKEPMEVTEPAQAEMLHQNGVNLAEIESNNGGRGFARSVERILSERYQDNSCAIKAFHQSKNKVARILSNATWVMNHIYYPVNWQDRWPDYYDAMTKYQREGKNKHDDAPDATTGVAEKTMRRRLFSFGEEV